MESGPMIGERGTPRVSVVMASYNHEAYVAQAIESVLDSTVRDLELIVVDDGSEDGTVDVINRINDPRLLLVCQENAGAHRAMNTGVDLARAQWIAFLNSDDVFHPNKLDAHLALHKEKSWLEASVTRIHYIDESGSDLDVNRAEWRWYRNALETFSRQPSLYHSLLLINHLVTTSALFVNKEVFKELGGFAGLRYTHDWLMFLSLAARNRFAIIDENLLRYRVHDRNTIKEDMARVDAEVNFLVAWSFHRQYRSGRARLSPQMALKRIQENSRLSPRLFLLFEYLAASQQVDIESVMLSFLRNDHPMMALAKSILEEDREHGGKLAFLETRLNEAKKAFEERDRLHADREKKLLGQVSELESVLSESRNALEERDRLHADREKKLLGQVSELESVLSESRNALEERDRLHADREKKLLGRVSELESVLSESRSTAEENELALSGQVRELDGRLSETARDLSEMEAAMVRKDNLIEEARRDAAERKRSVDELQGRLHQARNDLNDLRSRSEHLNREVLDMRELVSLKDAHIQNIMNSRSWKITRPLRWVVDHLSAKSGTESGSEQTEPAEESVGFTTDEEFPLAVIARYYGAASETFIRRHMFDLLPKKTVIIAHEECSPFGWPDRSEGPVLILENLPAEVDRGKAVSEFLQGHHVKVVLGEFLDIGWQWTDTVLDLGIDFFGHAHGIDVSRYIRDPEWQARYLDYNKTSGIITMSRVSKKRLTGIGLREEKIFVVPYGVDVPELREFSPNGDEVACLAVGRFIPKKAPLKTLEAFRMASEKNPKMKLTFVGDGPLREAAQSFVKEKGLSEKVRFTGVIRHADVRRLMNESDIFLQHSVTDPQNGDEEGLPVAILEAMASALPVVATRHAGIGEAVVDGTTGLLVEEGDVTAMAECLVELSATPEKRLSMGREGWNRASAGFSWDNEKRELLKILGLSGVRQEPQQ